MSDWASATLYVQIVLGIVFLTVLLMVWLDGYEDPSNREEATDEAKPKGN